MRRILSGFVAILILLSMSGAARAEENVKTVAGFKTWINSWKSEKAGSESIKSNTIPLVGWAAEVEFTNRVFVGVSYLLSALDYRLNQTAGLSEVERNDFELEAGYQANRYAGVFTGYRSTQFLQSQGDAKSKVTRYGPLVGIRGAAPLNDTLSLFGKFIYLPMSNKMTYAVADQKETATGWFAEVGVRYVFTKKLSGALGYKYESDRGKNTKVMDAFSGTTLDVMYSF